MKKVDRMESRMNQRTIPTEPPKIPRKVQYEESNMQHDEESQYQISNSSKHKRTLPVELDYSCYTPEKGKRSDDKPTPNKTIGRTPDHNV